MIDPFKNGFTLVQLTAAIMALPNRFSKVTDAAVFGWKPQTTPTATIEMKNGVLALVPTTPWGGVAPKNSPDRRIMRAFPIPHMPFEDTVLATDVMGVRAFGTENSLATVTGAVNDKLQSMKDKIDQTLEWRQMGALKGMVLDADGTVLADYFTEFGVTKKVVTFDFSDPAFDVRSACVSVVRHIEDNLVGDRMTNVHAYVSGEFFDGLVGHPKVQAAYAGWSEAANKLGGDLRKGFTFGGITFEEYRASVDGKAFIDAGEGHAFPKGTFNTFVDFGAPADFNETVNTLARPYYAKQKNKDFERGVDIHVQANHLPLVTRPGAIVELVGHF